MADKYIDVNDPAFRSARASIITELLFVLLPFLVLIIVLAYRNHAPDLFREREWSIASSVLFGQTLIKMVSYGLRAGSNEVLTEIFVLFLVVLLVLGLVPSLAVLILILVSDSVSTALAVTQLVIFVLSMIAFVGLGTYSQAESAILEAKKPARAASK